MVRAAVAAFAALAATAAVNAAPLAPRQSTDINTVILQYALTLVCFFRNPALSDPANVTRFPGTPRGYLLQGGSSEVRRGRLRFGWLPTMGSQAHLRDWISRGAARELLVVCFAGRRRHSHGAMHLQLPL